MTTLRPFTQHSPHLPVRGRRRAFSLIEMLVAIAIFSVLLAAVFIPIKIAADLSSVGTSRANTQQAAVDGLKLMRKDISRAIAILPNDRTVGVTDVYPYTANNGFPYRRNTLGYKVPSAKDTTDGTSDLNACLSTGTNAAVAAPNTARLDLILPATSNNNLVDPNIRSNNVLVSYYARRLDIRKAFDPIENPVVLFRAQIPFQYVDGSGATKAFPAWGSTTGPPYNANLSNQRFDTTTCDRRSLEWLTMNQYGEFDLTRLALPQVGASGSPNNSPTFGSHQLVLPRDTSLLTPNAATDTTATPQGNMSLVPDTTFVCADTNKDGKIDTVTIQLSVGQYDENAANRRSNPGSGTPGKSMLVPQVARTLTETVFNPNVQ